MKVIQCQCDCFQCFQGNRDAVMWLPANNNLLRMSRQRQGIISRLLYLQQDWGCWSDKHLLMCISDDPDVKQQDADMDFMETGLHGRDTVCELHTSESQISTLYHFIHYSTGVISWWFKSVKRCVRCEWQLNTEMKEYGWGLIVSYTWAFEFSSHLRVKYWMYRNRV